MSASGKWNSAYAAGEESLGALVRARATAAVVMNRFILSPNCAAVVFTRMCSSLRNLTTVRQLASAGPRGLLILG